MPELPDVETLKQYLDRRALNKKITAVEVIDRRLIDGLSGAELARRLEGQSLSGSHRHGKFLFCHVNDDNYLVLHFGMTGELNYIDDPHQSLPDHTRVAITFNNGHRLAIISRRMLGRIGYTDHPERYLSEQGLGPDALAIDHVSFLDRLREHNGSVKSVLMNQSILAGIGNVYADEILFQARLHPKTRIDQLSENEVNALHRITQRVLKTAIRHGADITKLPNRYLLRHREAGQSCPECGGPIAKLTISGRSSYVCSRCQKAPG